MSASAYFEATVMAYHAEAKECHRPLHVLSERGQRKLAESIWMACERVWPGDDTRPAWMFALKLTETYVGPSIREPIREYTYGPFCLTVFEAREAGKVLDLPLPRASHDVIDLLQDDYRLSALLTAWTLMAYEHGAGDRVRGLLSYKYGALGLARARAAQGGDPMTALWPWQRFTRKYDEVKCVEQRVLYAAPATCGCLR